MVWDKNTPLGTEAVSNGDDRIRELKEDLETALRGDDVDGVEAKFPGADTANPVFRYRGLKGSTAARPAAGQYGLYCDETRNVIQRDNGSSWVDIATLIPAGTVMLFYQAAAPVGWTKIVTQNDKVLRVVSGGTGGTAGGTNALSTAAHTHSIASGGAHTHTLSKTSTVGSLNYTGANSVGNLADGGVLRTIGAAGGESVRFVSDQVDSQGAHDHGALTGSQSLALAYIDIILCSKD